MRFSVAVEVSLRPGIADPQGATIERSLPVLGFAGIGQVRTGKMIRFDLQAGSRAEAEQRTEELCRTFLTNPVIEDATVTMSEAGQAEPAAQARARA